MSGAVEFEIFSFPNCARCDDLKAYLSQTGIEGREYDLTRREGKKRIREYLKVLNRDEKGGIIIPTLVIRESGEVAAVLNTREELGAWLTSRG